MPLHREINFRPLRPRLWRRKKNFSFKSLIGPRASRPIQRSPFPKAFCSIAVILLNLDFQLLRIAVRPTLHFQPSSILPPRSLAFCEIRIISFAERSEIGGNSENRRGGKFVSREILEAPSNSMDGIHCEKKMPASYPADGIERFSSGT